MVQEDASNHYIDIHSKKACTTNVYEYSYFMKSISRGGRPFNTFYRANNNPNITR